MPDAEDSPGGGVLRLVQRSADVLSRWPADLLTAAERGRCAALTRPTDRDDFVAAHLLAREAVGGLLELETGSVTLVQRCGTCAGPHGRPAVRGRPDVHVSWAHTGGQVQAAASFRPLGVDLERLDALPAGAVEPGLLRRCATAAEAEAVAAGPLPHVAFLLLWVAKESLVKAGAFELDDMAQVELAQVTDYAVSSWTEGEVAVGLATG